MYEAQFEIMFFSLFFHQTSANFESLLIDSYEIQGHPTVLKIKKTSPRFDKFFENLALTYYRATRLMQSFGSLSES